MFFVSCYMCSFLFHAVSKNCGSGLILINEKVVYWSYVFKSLQNPYDLRYNILKSLRSPTDLGSNNLKLLYSPNTLGSNNLKLFYSPNDLGSICLKLLRSPQWTWIQLLFWIKSLTKILKFYHYKYSISNYLLSNLTVDITPNGLGFNINNNLHKLLLSRTRPDSLA